jgi:hypothetical protein
MRVRGAAVRWFAIALLGSLVGLAAVGAIVAALTGRGVWHSMAWAVFIGGAVLAVLNVVSGSSNPPIDPRTGFGFGAFLPDSSPSAGWLVVGLALAAIGGVSLFVLAV